VLRRRPERCDFAAPQLQKPIAAEVEFRGQRTPKVGNDYSLRFDREVINAISLVHCR
jgi:hypothetical protein